MWLSYGLYIFVMFMCGVVFILYLYGFLRFNKIFNMVCLPDDPGDTRPGRTAHAQVFGRAPQVAAAGAVLPAACPDNHGHAAPRPSKGGRMWQSQILACIAYVPAAAFKLSVIQLYAKSCLFSVKVQTNEFCNS